MNNEVTDIFDIYKRFLNIVDDPTLSANFEFDSDTNTIIKYIDNKDYITTEKVTDKKKEAYIKNIQTTLMNLFETSLTDEFQGFGLNVDIDYDEMTINPKLDNAQTTVLVLGMVNAWVEKQIHKSTLMRPSIHDRDFSETSHATQLASLIDLRDANQQRMRRMVHNWSNVHIKVNG